METGALHWLFAQDVMPTWLASGLPGQWAMRHIPGAQQQARNVFASVDRPPTVEAGSNGDEKDHRLATRHTLTKMVSHRDM